MILVGHKIKSLTNCWLADGNKSGNKRSSHAVASPRFSQLVFLKTLDHSTGTIIMKNLNTILVIILYILPVYVFMKLRNLSYLALKI